MSYRIADEPRPSTLAHLAVNPVWPLFGVMFGGAALSWSWFLLNGAAIGSPTRRQEIAWAFGGLAGSLALILTISYLAGQEIIGRLGIRYTLVALTVWKLAVSYWLFTLQSRSFHLYEHFGGTVRNGALIVVVGFFITNRLYQGLDGFWVLLLR